MGKTLKKQPLFDLRQTNIAKGLALLMLLWHHLFFNSAEYYDLFVSVYNHGSKPIECSIAVFCKVCVAIFLMLSGYGLFKSFEKYSSRNQVDGKLPVTKQLVFVKNHLIKMMSGYVFIYVIFVLLGFLFGRNPVEIYQGNILYMIVDFLGLSFLFSFPTMNATWWFMSIIIVYYIIFPILNMLMKYCAELLLLVSGFLMLMPLPDYKDLILYLFPFVLGMYISKYDLFYRLSTKLNTVIKALGFCAISILFFAYFRQMYFGKVDAFFGFCLIILSYLIISKIPVLNKVFEQLGKYSSMIFMFHTFIFSYYFKDLIYGMKYSFIIYPAFVVICYLIAFVLSWLKKIIGYDKLVAKITK